MRISSDICAMQYPKHDSVTDYLHKVTRYLAEYCREQGITCVVAGDIRNIWSKKRTVRNRNENTGNNKSSCIALKSKQ